MEKDNFYKVEIDGRKCEDLVSFLEEVGIAFRFPSYYGRNLNAFWDCIGDLSWIYEPNYSLTIKNSNYFLAREDEGTKRQVLDLLDKVRYDWAHVPNYDGEDSYRQKADFLVTFT